MTPDTSDHTTCLRTLNEPGGQRGDSNRKDQGRKNRKIPHSSPKAMNSGRFCIGTGNFAPPPGAGRIRLLSLIDQLSEPLRSIGTLQKVTEVWRWLPLLGTEELAKLRPFPCARRRCLIDRAICDQRVNTQHDCLQHIAGLAKSRGLSIFSRLSSDTWISPSIPSSISRNTPSPVPK